MAKFRKGEMVIVNYPWNETKNFLAKIVRVSEDSYRVEGHGTFLKGDRPRHIVNYCCLYKQGEHISA